MAIVDKTKQRFDENIKADKLGLINALIHASNQLEDFKPKLKAHEVQLDPSNKMILRLIPYLEIFRLVGRGTAFGSSYEDALINLQGKITDEEWRKYKKRFDSLRTAGGEMGIWVDSNFTLSKLAKKVGNHEISLKKYLSVVFLNLFSFFKNPDNSSELVYKHFLYEVLIYIKSNGIMKTYSKESLVKIFNFYEEDNPTKRNNQRNILFDYLISTIFFEAKSKDSFRLIEVWQKGIDELIEICNLEYEYSNLETVKEKLNREKKAKEYANYVSQKYEELNQLEYHLSSHQTLKEKNNLKKEELKVNAFNRIYYGAPGTGKSYGIESLIKDEGISDYTDSVDHPNVYRTTFHPEYEYGDFIGQIMPVIKKDINNGQGNSIIYEFVPRTFTNALKRSLETSDPVFLIIEEMSRANVASVFGDIFQLLDRDETGKSEYKIYNPLIAKEVFGEDEEESQIYIPNNLFIIGTVNTSDQNVYVMDTAFKRRFEFVYLSTNRLVSKEDEYLNNYSFTLSKDMGENIEISWIELLTALNEFIVKDSQKGGLGLPEDKQLGQFFIKFRLNNDSSTIEEREIIKNEQYNYSQITGKLLHYLWEDVQRITYSGSKIFDSTITSFSNLYDIAVEKKFFFSKTFEQELTRSRNS